MAVRYSSPVYGYVEKPLKERLRQLKKADPGLSESYLINECLRDGLGKFEKEAGIRNPARESRSPSRVPTRQELRRRRIRDEWLRERV